MRTYFNNCISMTAVSTDEKYSQKPRVSTERFKNFGEKFAQLYKPVYPSMITQVIISVLQLNYDKHFNEEN